MTHSCPCTDGNCLSLPVTELLLLQNIEEHLPLKYISLLISTPWSCPQCLRESPLVSRAFPFFFFFIYFSESLGYSMCQITVTNMDGKPVADRTVLLDLNEIYLANYTTDKNGTAAFSIDTSNIFDPSFKLSVSKYSLNPEKILRWRERLEGISACWQDCFRWGK